MDKKLMETMIQLEIEHDSLYQELKEIDHLMRQVGFRDGLWTVKETAKEIRRKNLSMYQCDSFDETE